jgi:adenylate kinase
MRHFILLGPPGSGKGTQAERITAKYNIPVVATGDIFRQNIAAGTALGKEAKAYMDKGELVPDEIVVGLVVDRLKQPDVKDGYLLDGFPRTIAQAEALQAMTADTGGMLEKVIYINTPRDALIRRIAGRRVCESCGKTYNIPTFPPKVEGVCDLCGDAIIQRSDDAEATAVNRIDVYNEQTKPLVDYYRQKGLLAEFDGTEPIEETFAGIERLIGDR